MASQKMPKDLAEKVETSFRDEAQKQADAQKAIWDKTQPKRELASYMLQKLTQDDKVAQRLMEEADKASLELSRKPLEIPLRHKPAVNVKNFTPTGVTLYPSEFADWKSRSDIEITSTSTGNPNFAWSITTDGGRGSESVSAMLYNQVQPPPGSRFMTATAHPSIVFSYGNHAWGVHSHTHAWIGLQVAEFDEHGNPIRTVYENRGNIFDLTTDHDFSSSGQPSLLAPNIAVVDNHIYTVGVQCGGDVESSKRSYANLNVSVDHIFVNFS